MQLLCSAVGPVMMSHKMHEGLIQGWTRVCDQVSFAVKPSLYPWAPETSFYEVRVVKSVTVDVHTKATAL